MAARDRSAERITEARLVLEEVADALRDVEPITAEGIHELVVLMARLHISWRRARLAWVDLCARRQEEGE